MPLLILVVSHISLFLSLCIYIYIYIYIYMLNECLSSDITHIEISNATHYFVIALYWMRFKTTSGIRAAKRSVKWLIYKWCMILLGRLCGLLGKGVHLWMTGEIGINVGFWSLNISFGAFISDAWLSWVVFLVLLGKGVELWMTGEIGIDVGFLPKVLSTKTNVLLVLNTLGSKCPQHPTSTNVLNVWW